MLNDKNFVRWHSARSPIGHVYCLILVANVFAQIMSAMILSSSRLASKAWTNSRLSRLSQLVPLPRPSDQLQ